MLFLPQEEEVEEEEGKRSPAPVTLPRTSRQPRADELSS